VFPCPELRIELGQFLELKENLHQGRKISNLIRAESLLKLQEEKLDDGGPPELLLHTALNGLSGGKFL